MKPSDERPDTGLEPLSGCVIAANVAAAIILTVIIFAIAYAAAQ